MPEYKTPDYQRKANAKYAANNVKSVSLSFNFKYDADILAYFEKVESVQGFIKDCIRSDLYGVQKEKTVD